LFITISVVSVTRISLSKNSSANFLPRCISRWKSLMSMAKAKL